jgi:hypothetical protein
MRIFLVVLLLASGFMALRHADTPVPDHAAVAAAGTATEAGVAAVSSTSSRLRHGVGTGVSRLIAPGVHSMTARTGTMVASLEPAIRRAPPHRANRARDISRQIAVTDSLARRSLTEGQPINAVRLALKGRGLVDAVRHQVLEETMR